MPGVRLRRDTEGSIPPRGADLFRPRRARSSRVRWIAVPRRGGACRCSSTPPRPGSPASPRRSSSKSRLSLAGRRSVGTLNGVDSGQRRRPQVVLRGSRRLTGAVRTGPGSWPRSLPDRYVVGDRYEERDDVGDDPRVDESRSARRSTRPRSPERWPARRAALRHARAVARRPWSLGGCRAGRRRSGLFRPMCSSRRSSRPSSRRSCSSRASCGMIFARLRRGALEPRVAARGADTRCSGAARRDRCSSVCILTGQPCLRSGSRGSAPPSVRVTPVLGGIAGSTWLLVALEPVRHHPRTGRRERSSPQPPEPARRPPGLPLPRLRRLAVPCVRRRRRSSPGEPTSRWIVAHRGAGRLSRARRSASDSSSARTGRTRRSAAATTGPGTARTPPRRPACGYCVSALGDDSGVAAACSGSGT